MLQEHFVMLGEILTRLEDKSAHIVLDQEGIVQAWSVTAEQLFGWTADETQGQSLAILVVPTYLRETHRAGIAKWQEDITPLIVCKRLRTVALHKDGHTLLVDIHVQLVRDDHGVRFLGWVVPVVVEEAHGDAP